LLAAAAASDVVPSLGPSVRSVEWIATAALVVILFDGGASIGLRRFRVAAAPIVTLGIVGTFATAGVVAIFAHWAFDFGWTTAGLLGAAVAPTDPAVMFSVLGGHQIRGRAGTILEGESGTNDPVGIALMLGLIELATHADETFWVVVRIFCEQMGIGLAVGILGGLAERRLHGIARHPARTLALAAVVFAVADLAHGSGFLAVFVAGVIAGERRSPFNQLASLSEVVVFVALGLTVSLSSIGLGGWADGLALAAVAALVARPLAGVALLAPTSLRRNEIVFVIWGGLKGAVPILLAAFAVTEHAPHAARIYDLVFVVVLASVAVQGGTIGWAARKLRI
jgi:cell volume regulation protein A